MICGRICQTAALRLRSVKGFIMGKKILVVDDAAFMRKLIRETLISGGHTDIVEAEDGYTACDKYFAERPDLVIMDITMPNMSGIEALHDIREKDPEAKVIMCSAMGQESMVVEAIKIGALDFIVKPFKPELLISAVEKIFEAE